jgi:hypothetical protein
MSNADVEKAKQEILNYLRKHPDASDDLEGITRFWVTRERIEAAAETVERALMSLVEEGVLKKEDRYSPSGEVLGGKYTLHSRGSRKA